MLFSVELQSLRKYILQHYNSIAHNFYGEVKEELNNFFYQLNAISQQQLILKSVREVDINIFEKKGNKVEQLQKRKSEEIKEKEMISMPEFNEGSSKSKESFELEEENEGKKQVDDFWNEPIDWKDKNVNVELAPFTLLDQTPLAKVHFLFTMLNVSQIFVINEGVLVGIITKKEFLGRKHQDSEELHESLSEIDHVIMKNEGSNKL